MPIGPYLNQSLLAQQVLVESFRPQLSANIMTGTTSTSVTFSPVTGTIGQTFKIINKSTTNGAYIGWGAGSATAVASTTTPTANCDYIGPGMCLIETFQSSNGITNTIAVIQDTGGSAVLEISVGFGV